MRIKLKHLAAVSITAFLTACSSGEKPGAQIDTPQGPVVGVVSEAGVNNYMGIPYAAPPVGDLRWRPPAAAPDWTETRIADEFSAQCMQETTIGGKLLMRLVDGHGVTGIKRWLIDRSIKNTPAPTVSEDCLYLNVRTPNIAPDGSVKDDPLPVMVWIHGGAHQFGSSDTELYQTDSLPLKGVVLVTINYRLGAFGYLAHPAISEDDPRGVSGNYGTLDQMAALEWVRDNISAYGGDPDNVTIFGESAGAWSVTELMASPLAEGLFHKAIGQSGSATYHLGDMSENPLGWVSGYEASALLEDALGLENPRAEDLREVPADKIISVITPEMSDGFHHVRDGVVFPKNVGIAFRDGDINSVPSMFGYNTDEATLFFPDDPEPIVWAENFPREGREAMIAALKPHYGAASESIIDLYGLDADGNFEAAGTQVMGDDIFGVNVRYASRKNAETGQPAYLYSFGRIPPDRKQYLGATHILEIPFVFDSHIKVLGVTKSDAELTKIMQAYWVNFAKTGNPNGEGLPEWPEHKGENWMQFGGNNNLETGPIKHHRRAKLDALEMGLTNKLEALSPTLFPQSQDGSD